MKRFYEHILVIMVWLTGCGLAQAQDERVIVMIGDSLTAGYNLSDAEALPHQLEQVLHEAGHDHVRIINAGVSGDTSADGLNRFAFSTGGDVDGVIIALGGNDALNGLPVDGMKANLNTMIEQARARELDVLLVGLIPPVNLGEDYRQQFLTVFPELAQTHDIPLHADLMGEVALDPERLMADGVHPTAEGVVRMAEDLAATLIDVWLTSTSGS